MKFSLSLRDFFSHSTLGEGFNDVDKIGGDTDAELEWNLELKSRGGIGMCENVPLAHRRQQPFNFAKTDFQ